MLWLSLVGALGINSVGALAMDSGKMHWEGVYSQKGPTEVSWFQDDPKISVQMINATGIAKNQPIIDAGGGASTLVNHLLDAGFQRISVLDISRSALDYAKKRLGDRANQIEWIEGDVTEYQANAKFSIWHDRAVFHFLTDEGDRQKYMRVVKEALAPDGHLIMATFAIDGPQKCSGLNVVQYEEKTLSNAVGNEFELKETIFESHTTPWNVTQKFIYCRFQRVGKTPTEE